MKENLKHLPSVDSILQRPAVQTLMNEWPRPIVVKWVRTAIDQLRSQILAGRSVEPKQMDDNVEATVLEQHQRDRLQALQPVINATGILLHTNLGRSPLSEAAVRRMGQSAGYTNLELDLHDGKRSRRGDRALKLLCELTGAEEALVVNNCAAATILVLQAVAAGKEVIIARGQLVEIGGGFRLPDVFRAAGVTLREVGTTNRTYLADYAQAVNANTGAVIRVHHSNFRQIGFVVEPSIQEMVGIARPDTVPVIDDVGSGCVLTRNSMRNMAGFDLNEPVVQESVEAGADLVLFSGDKLLAGPQCGIVIGKSEWIHRLRSNPLMRALRVDKVTLAALEATLECHLAGRAVDELPFYRMLSKSAESIQASCRQVFDKLEVPSGLGLSIEPCTSQVGGGSIPGYDLPSFAVTIQSDSSERFSAALRTTSRPVMARQVENRVLLDLRTVSEAEIPQLIAAVQQAIAIVEGGRQVERGHKLNNPHRHPATTSPFPTSEAE